MKVDMAVTPLVDEIQFKAKSSLQKSRMDIVMSELQEWSPYANHAFKNHTGPAWSCAITSDCAYAFTGSTDSVINVWNVETKDLYAELSAHTNTVSFLFVIKKDTVLVSGSWDCTIKLWDWRNKTVLNTLVGHNGDIYSMMITDNEKMLIAGDKNKEVKVWDLDNYNLLGTPFSGVATPFGLGFNHAKSEIVVGGFNEMIYIYNTSDYKEITNFKSKPNIQCLTVTRDGKYIIVGTRANVIHVYNYEDKSEYCTFTSHTHWIRNLIVLKDDFHLLSASPDKSMRVFNLKTKAEEFVIEGNEGFINGICISKDEQYLLAASSDGVIRIWKLGFPERVTKLFIEKTSALSMVFSADNKWIICGCQDGSLRIWSYSDHSLIKILNSHSSAIRGLHITSDSKLLASGGEDSKVVLYDTSCFDYTQLSGHNLTVHVVSISLDKKYVASGDQDMKIILWDVATKSNYKILTGHTDTIFIIVFTKDRKMISSGADKTIRIWSTNDFREIEKFNTSSAIIDALTISPDEKCMVYGDRKGYIYLWDYELKYFKRKIKAHDNFVLKIVFWSDSDTFTTTSTDKVVKVWSFRNERLESTFIGHGGSVRSGYISNDRKFLITAAIDNTIRIWAFANIGLLESCGVGHSLESYLFTSQIKLKSPVANIDIKMSISPLKVNLAHIYCYLGYDSLLYDALVLGTEIKTDLDGRSPIYYSLERNSQECTNIIIKYLVEIHKKDLKRFLDSVKSMKNDFQRLISTNSVNLEGLITAMFYQIPEVANFGIPKGSLPLVLYEDLYKLDTNLFLYEKRQYKTGQIEIPIQFKMLPFPIPFVKGSRISLVLLDSIINCKNTRIMETEFIQSYLRNKWNSVWWFIMAMTVILWSNIIVMILLIFRNNEKGVSNSEFILLSLIEFVLNGLLLFYELVQMMASGLVYFEEIWNLIDVCRVSITISWIIIQNSSTALPNNFNMLTWFMVLLNFLRGLSGFRAFDWTRFYTRLIIRAFFDSIFFLLIFFYSTVAFGVLYYTTENPDYIRFSIWSIPYELNMGSFNNTKEFSLEYVCFIIASIINVIIILNLLISILGDSFDNFQAEADQINYLEMAEYLREIETLMFWRRRQNYVRYFYKCQNAESGITNSWEGRIKAISDMVDELKENFSVEMGKQNKEFGKQFDALKKQNDEILSRLPPKA